MDATLALIHIEVESRDAVATIPRRMFDYYTLLRRDHDCPVLPIAVYLRVGRDGVGVENYAEDFAGLAVLRFQYLYVGLPALEAEQYVAGSNWLGVALAALMHLPPARKVWLRVEALRRILLECPENDYRRFLLQECVEAYLQLSAEEQGEFERMLHTEPYKEIEPMMATTFEKGLAKGREEAYKEIEPIMATTFEKGVAKGRDEGRQEGRDEGRQEGRREGRQEGRDEGRREGRREAARLFLEQKFGRLSETALSRLAAWPAERLDDLIRAIFAAPSLQALGLAEEEPRS